MIEITPWISVRASEVMNKLGFSADMINFERAVDQWSFGDAHATLVGNKEFLSALKEEGFDIDEEEYWSIVPSICYINLEE